jgi:DNA-binding XRE family transcriptional regulator
MTTQTSSLSGNEASPPGCDGHAQEKDAGSTNSSAICATEDALSRRPALPGGRGLVFRQAPSPGAAYATCLDQCRITEARFVAVDSILYVRFEDGLARAVRWADLPFTSRLGLAPVSASTGSAGESLTVIDGSGRAVDVSAESLRAALDEDYHGRLLSADDTERIVAGARLRAAREGLGLSQLELSRRSGIAQESLSRIETGRRDPRLGTLQRLARGMGLSLDQLMGRLSAAP